MCIMIDNEGKITSKLPIKKEPIDRPLVVFHPAAGYQYRASWSVMEDNGEPFILIANDYCPDYPDGYPGLSGPDEDGWIREVRKALSPILDPQQVGSIQLGGPRP